jgi:Protein NO VEIN, C-terminal
LLSQRNNDITFRDFNSAKDVLSVLDETDASLLRIEVKGSSMPVSDAFFFVSRHEWEVASDGKAYWFYLWIIRQPLPPECRFVTAVEVAAHIATDQGDGKWDAVKVPFKCFWNKK